MRMGVRHALALDVGGTKLSAAVVDESGRLSARARCAAPHGDDGEALFAALVGCARAALAEAPADLAGVGVACAGPIVVATGSVSPINMPAWRGFPLRDRLIAELAIEPVVIDNDAVGIAAGEHWAGAARGLDHVLAVTVSTGIGGGLVLDGRLHHGASGNAGHIGHLVVDPEGPSCACGGRGCLEAVASGPRTVERALAAGWRPAAGEGADGIGLAMAAERGDPVAAEALARSGRALGAAFASAAVLLDLQAIVVVGGFSRSGEPLWGPLRDSFAEHVGLEYARACRIIPGDLGDDAGLVGAGAFVLAPGTRGSGSDPSA
jgi:glucokinase